MALILKCLCTSVYCLLAEKENKVTTVCNEAMPSLTFERENKKGLQFDRPSN